MLDNNTGLLEIHSNQILINDYDSSKTKKIASELIEKISKMIKQQMAIMIDLVDEGFHLEAKQKDPKYY